MKNDENKTRDKKKRTCSRCERQSVFLHALMLNLKFFRDVHRKTTDEWAHKGSQLRQHQQKQSVIT